MKTLICWVWFFFLVCGALNLRAANRYVARNGQTPDPVGGYTTWVGAASNIQDAVSVATPGETIWVRQGVYKRADPGPVVAIVQSQTLKSETGNASDVIIDGEGARRGILVTLTVAGSEVMIEGVTVTNGYTPSAAHSHGAGVYVSHAAIAAGTATVSRCVFACNFNNGSYGHNHGGGLASRGRAGTAFHTSVTNCVFSGNVTTNRDSSGGGAAFENTRLTLTDCRFENNRAAGDISAARPGNGGGVYVENVITGSVIRRTSFQGNFAQPGGGSGWGGGLCIVGADTDLTVANCTFEDNLAAYGSGVMQRDGRGILRHCRIGPNRRRPAFYQGWGGSTPAARLVNCSIAGGITPAHAGTLEAVDAMKDPAVLLDADGNVMPVRTLDDWNRRRAITLQRIQQLAGPLPDTSLFPPPNITVLQDDLLDGPLRRQKIEYCAESTAAPRIKAWLFSPTTNSCLEDNAASTHTRAAVLCLHQTNRSIGKNEPAGLEGDTNYFYAIELARRGFVTLAPDFTGSGDHLRLGTYSNDYVSATMKGVADHIRAVDILSALPGVDPQRIGCIGHSLGGFNTMMVSVFEPRIKAIVSSCGYVNWQAYADRESSLYLMAGPNYMPLIGRDYANRADLVPFDWHEVVAALAPRPLFVNAPLRDDPFLVEGVCETLTDAKPIYELYGAADGVQTTHPDCGHGFPPEVREQAYRFLERHLDGTIAE